MSARDWPTNWPDLEDIVAILRASPRGCRRGNFAELDARRKRGVVAVMGYGWIHIRKRLLADGIAELTNDGALAYVDPEDRPTQPATSPGVKSYTVPEIVAALEAAGLGDHLATVGHYLRNPAPPAPEPTADLGEPETVAKAAPVADDEIPE